MDQDEIIQAKGMKRRLIKGIMYKRTTNPAKRMVAAVFQTHTKFFWEKRFFVFDLDSGIVTCFKLADKDMEYTDIRAIDNDPVVKAVTGTMDFRQSGVSIKIEKVNYDDHVNHISTTTSTAATTIASTSTSMHYGHFPTPYYFSITSKDIKDTLTSWHICAFNLDQLKEFYLSIVNYVFDHLTHSPTLLGVMSKRGGSMIGLGNNANNSNNNISNNNMMIHTTGGTSTSSMVESRKKAYSVDSSSPDGKRDADSGGNLYGDVNGRSHRRSMDAKDAKDSNVVIDPLVNEYFNKKLQEINEKGKFIERITSTVRRIEFFVGFVLLNILLTLVRVFSSDDLQFEGLFFILAINFFVFYSLIFRIEQLALHPKGKDDVKDILRQKNNSKPLPQLLNPASAKSLPSLTNDAKQKSKSKSHKSEEDADNDDDDDDGASSESSNDNQSFIKNEPEGNTDFVAGNGIPRSPEWDNVQAGWDVDSKNPKYRKHPGHTWARCDATKIEVRIGPDYPRNGHKEKSGPALFDIIGADLFVHETKLDLIGKKLQLPITSSMDPPKPFPRLLIVNFQVQLAGTSVFFPYGSPGYSFVMYFEPSSEFLSENSRNKNSYRLAERYFETWDTDVKMKERLKLKVIVLNTEASGIPNWATGYNGKPCMIKKSNIMTKEEEIDLGTEFVEMDIDLRSWSVLCRQGVNAILPTVHNIDFVISLIIEGVDDSELPEQVLCCARINFLDISKAIKWDVITKQQSDQ